MNRKKSVPLILLLLSSLLFVFNFQIKPAEAVFGSEDIFFEYGAESETIQPPWDKAGPWGGESTGRGSATISTVQARTNDHSVKLWQDDGSVTAKEEADRRVVLREYIGTSEKDVYWSVWAWYPNINVWNGNANYWHTGIGISWAIKTTQMVDFSGVGFQMHRNGYIQISYSNYFDSDDDYLNVTGWYVYDNLAQWVHFQCHLKFANDTSGVAECWINNVKYLDLTGLRSDPTGFTDFQNNYYFVGGSPLVGASLYSDKSSLEATLYYDDLVASREKVTESYGVGEVSSEFESWEDGFESGDYSKWNNTHYSGGGVAPTITSTHAYTGTYAANFTTDGADASYADAMHIIQDTSEVYQRSYVRFEDLPDSNNTRLMVMRMEHASTYITAVGAMNMSGNMYWCIDITGGDVNPPENYTLATINADQWYLLEFYFNSTANGNATLWVNNVLQCQETGDYSSHGDLQQVYPYLYVEQAQVTGKTVYHDNYRVDNVRIGGGTPINIYIEEQEEDEDQDEGGVKTLTTYSNPLGNVVINGTYATDIDGYYEFTNLTYNTEYLFVVELPSGYYPRWVQNFDGSFSWNTTHFLVYHNITETHEGYLEIVFTAADNDPYISEASGTIKSFTTSYSSTSRNIIVNMTDTSTAVIETRERFTPDYYGVTGATDWFWNGLNYTFEVEGTSAVTVEWR